MRHGPDELGNPGHRGLCAYEWGQIAKSTHNHPVSATVGQRPDAGVTFDSGRCLHSEETARGGMMASSAGSRMEN
jgi:hypothetical protein